MSLRLKSRHLSSQIADIMNAFLAGPVTLSVQRVQLVVVILLAVMAYNHFFGCRFALLHYWLGYSTFWACSHLLWPIWRYRPVFEELHHPLHGIFRSFLFSEVPLASLQRVIHDSCELTLQAMRMRCRVRFPCWGIDFEVVFEKARELKAGSSFVSPNSSSWYRN